MKYCVTVVMLIWLSQAIGQSNNISTIKSKLETSTNPIAYVRDTLKKQFRLDTIFIMNTTHFSGPADSLAYHGKVRKVYGPYDRKMLVQILAKLPNSFNRVRQIFLDTSLFTRRIADSLANSIITKIKNGTTSFEEMAQTFSMGGEGPAKGDLGWMARGAVLPEVDKELAKRKKGEVFKVWSKNGLHIIRKSSDAKEDTGFVLLLKVLL